jgi:sterol 3beta-glucosyltransferase
VRFGAYPDFPQIASLQVRHIESEERLDERDISEPEIIRIGAVKPNAVWDRLKDVVREAKQKKHWRTMDHYSVFIDFGSLSVRETPPPWDGEGRVSKIKEKADLGGLLLDGDSHLWSKLSS